MSIKILVLSSCPKNADRLRLDQEIRDIQAGLQRAQNRNQFDFRAEWAVRPKDIRRAILDYKPNIVHFSGHGLDNGNLAFENELGLTQMVSPEALAGLFKIFSEDIQCVFLNACFSEAQANAIAQHINHVIGMKDTVTDSAAIEFAVGFYDALGAGYSVDKAYEIGRNAIHLAGIMEHNKTVLKLKSPNLISNLESNSLIKGTITPFKALKKGDFAKVKFEVTLKGSLENIDNQIVEDLLAYLKTRVQDPTLEIRLLEEGSIRIIFEGSEDAFTLLSRLIETRELEELMGFPIQNIRMLDKSMVTTDKKTLVSTKTFRTDSNELKRILLIDSDPNLILLVKDYLEFRGYQVITAETGQEALDILNNLIPDMIICDVMMPEMNGYDFVEQVRQDPFRSRIPILFLSAKGQSHYRERELTFGANVHVTKPFEPEELVAQIESSINQTSKFVQSQNKDVGSIPGTRVPFEVELTPTELKIVQFVAQGMANREIAERLKVNQRTIESYVSNMLGKTGLHSRTELVRWALENDKV